METVVSALVSSGGPGSSTASVPRVAPDSTPVSQGPQPQQAKQRPSSSLSSDFSLFELETFFTRWAPDPASSSSPPGGPACSYTADSAHTDPDSVIVVSQTQPQPQQPHPAPSAAPDPGSPPPPPSGSEGSSRAGRHSLRSSSGGRGLHRRRGGRRTGGRERPESPSLEQGGHDESGAGSTAAASS